jgi:hypothetical protein
MLGIRILGREWWIRSTTAPIIRAVTSSPDDSDEEPDAPKLPSHSQSRPPAAPSARLRPATGRATRRFKRLAQDRIMDIARGRMMDRGNASMQDEVEGGERVSEWINDVVSHLTLLPFCPHYPLIIPSTPSTYLEPATVPRSLHLSPQCYCCLTRTYYFFA